MMRRGDYGWSFLFLILLWSPAGGQNTRSAADERYTVAFASAVPLNTDIFIAAGDGSDARPLLAHPELDYNAPFSPDERSIVHPVPLGVSDVTTSAGKSSDILCQNGVRYPLRRDISP